MVQSGAIAIQTTPVGDSQDSEPLKRCIKVLLVKPYQKTPTEQESPPLGLLCLAASLKQAFNDKAHIKVLDMKLYRKKPASIQQELMQFDADIIGISALNCEAAAAREIASLAKSIKPSILTVLGGPYAHKRGEEILGRSKFDWVINGPGDRIFPEAIRRFINGRTLGNDILGLCYKKPDGSLRITDTQDVIEDLDALPMPDWKHIDFDLYSKRLNMMNMQKGRRYALLFTSRGCPYLCNYCHDVFGKRFSFQSAERVVQEIEYLYESFGVNEFQIVDDIFNLHKPRVKKIMHEVRRRWGGRIFFTFPNGVRADIIDEDVLNDLQLGGTYAMCVAIETATPRLQILSDKHLDIDKTQWVIEQANKRNISVTGFFMLGFPTETPEELEATINFALRSKLTLAYFFTVIPQPSTPLFALAQQVNIQALNLTTINDEEGRLSYRGDQGPASWYEYTYNFPLGKLVNKAHLKFYLAPARLWRIMTRTPTRSILKAAKHFIQMQLSGFLSLSKSQD